MIHLERIRIQLPSGFESRASDIARRIPDHLTNYRVSASLTRGNLTLPRLIIEPSATNPEIAAQIAGKLLQSLDQITGSPRIGDRKNADD